MPLAAGSHRHPSGPASGSVLQHTGGSGGPASCLAGCGFGLAQPAIATSMNRMPGEERIAATVAASLVSARGSGRCGCFLRARSSSGRGFAAFSRERGNEHGRECRSARAGGRGFTRVHVALHPCAERHARASMSLLPRLPCDTHRAECRSTRSTQATYVVEHVARLSRPERHGRR